MTLKDWTKTRDDKDVKTRKLAMTRTIKFMKLNKQ